MLSGGDDSDEEHGGGDADAGGGEAPEAAAAAAGAAWLATRRGHATAVCAAAVLPATIVFAVLATQRDGAPAAGDQSAVLYAALTLVLGLASVQIARAWVLLTPLVQAALGPAATTGQPAAAARQPVLLLLRARGGSTRLTRVDARHLALMLRGRDFTGDDYEALLRLDEDTAPSADAFLAGAAAEELSQLPTYRHVGASGGGGGGGSDGARACVICMELFEAGDELCLLPCMHQFHAGCVHRWLRSKAVCPSCQANIRDPALRLDSVADSGGSSHRSGEGGARGGDVDDDDRDELGAGGGGGGGAMDAAAASAGSARGRTGRASSAAATSGTLPER